MHYFLSLKSQGLLAINIDWSIFIWIVLVRQIILGILSDVFILNLGLHFEGLCWKRYILNCIWRAFKTSILNTGPRSTPMYICLVYVSCCLRASPVTRHLHLHLHFYIHDAGVDAGYWPNHPGITQIWMDCFAIGAELPAFCQVMQGACYQLKDKQFCWWSSWVWHLIGWDLTMSPIVTDDRAEFEKQLVDV